MYGDDPDTPLPDPANDDEGVPIPAIATQLTVEELTALQNNFDPLMDDNNYGINCYIQVRYFILLLYPNNSQ